MKEYKDEELSNALIQLWEEDKAKKHGNMLFPLVALLACGFILSFFSFLFYKEENDGMFGIAKEALSSFLEENEAIAVFLGMKDADER